MNANGVAWPATGGDQFNGVEASVLVAFSAGFVEASDFYGPARAALGAPLVRRAQGSPKLQAVIAASQAAAGNQ